MARSEIHAYADITFRLLAVNVRCYWNIIKERKGESKEKKSMPITARSIGWSFEAALHAELSMVSAFFTFLLCFGIFDLVSPLS